MGKGVWYLLRKFLLQNGKGGRVKAVEGRPTQKRPEKTKNHAYAGLPPIWPAAVSSGGSEVFVRSVGLKVEDSFSPTTATVGGRRPTSCHKTNPPDSERARERSAREHLPFPLPTLSTSNYSSFLGLPAAQSPFPVLLIRPRHVVGPSSFFKRAIDQAFQVWAREARRAVFRHEKCVFMLKRRRRARYK